MVIHSSRVRAIIATIVNSDTIIVERFAMSVSLMLNQQQQQKQEPQERKLLSPSDNLTQALNYREADATPKGFNQSASSLFADSNDGESPHKRILQMLREVNNSQFLYPGISIMVVSLLLIIMIFQKSINIIVKVLASVLYLIFIIYTVYNFRFK